MAIAVTCGHCKKQYSVPAYRQAITKYCSRRCSALAARTQIKADCQICGKAFEHISSRCNTAKYCSRKCYYKAMHLVGSVEYRCHHCHKKFRSPPSHKRKYCSRACNGKSRRETWQPKRTTLRRGMQRRQLLNECARCGYNAVPAILGIHHKDRNHDNNRASNLEVLCPNCHSIEHLKHITHGAVHEAHSKALPLADAVVVSDVLSV